MLTFVFMEQAISFFQNLLGSRCKIDEETRSEYSHDHTEGIFQLPAIVLFPNQVEEVSQILRYCHENRLPVTPIGARTGLSGGAIPVVGGIALSMEKFNTILEIDELNHQVTTEPGVITQVLQDTVKAKGLFYPPDPASKGSCFIGGNIAENSGGPKAVKYGVTAQYVLNLEVVLPTGEIIWTGANTLKNATGYNLTQLVVGSEGTLGVVTKIVLKLLPHPTHDLLLLVPFLKMDDACKAVASIYHAGIIPSCMEFMERSALEVAQKFADDYTLSLDVNAEAYLLIEVDGFNPDLLFSDCEKIMEVLEQFETGEILFAESQAQKDLIWSLRRKIGEAVKAISIYKEEDTVVPRYELPGLMRKVKELEQKYGFTSICYGHAGDGNLHINILKANLSDEMWNEQLPIAIRELFTYVVSKKGTLSGEHGIGLVQKPYMDIAFEPITLEIMRSIKKVFDPHHIMNPGKVI